MNDCGAVKKKTIQAKIPKVPTRLVSSLKKTYSK